MIHQLLGLMTIFIHESPTDLRGATIIMPIPPEYGSEAVVARSWGLSGLSLSFCRIDRLSQDQLTANLNRRIYDGIEDKKRQNFIKVIQNDKIILTERKWTTSTRRA
jgi:hypothetical protein